MEKTINKSNFIREAVEIYENDFNLFLRRAAILYNAYYISITSYLTNKIKPAPNYFIIYQKLTPVEESVFEQCQGNGHLKLFTDNIFNDKYVVCVCK
jgi:hypothetical protein